MLRGDSYGEVVNHQCNLRYVSKHDDTTTYVTSNTINNVVMLPHKTFDLVQHHTQCVMLNKVVLMTCHVTPNVLSRLDGVGRGLRE